jgi:hypothetical protein
VRQRGGILLGLSPRLPDDLVEDADLHAQIRERRLCGGVDRRPR